MTKDNLASFSARELSKKMRAGELKCQDLLKFHHTQIKRRQKNINAFTDIDLSGSEKWARKMDRIRLEQRTESLWGLCFSAKDNINVKGLTLSDGNKQTFKKSVQTTAGLVNKLQAAGAFCLGKGNMAEYGKSFITDNPYYGPTRNPFDQTRSAGGSSGGDAAAVAANFCSFALAADAGGSIRIPANFCGLFGLYPTRGTYSISGFNNTYLGPLNQFKSYGVIAQTLDDTELLHRILKGFDKLDPFSIPDLATSEFDHHTTKRFAYFSKMNGVEADKEIGTALKKTVAELEAQGFKAKNLTPACFEDCAELYITLGVQACLALEDSIAKQNSTPRKQAEEGLALKMLRNRLAHEFPGLTSERLLAAWNKLDQLRLQACKLFHEYDFILCPVAPILAPELNNPKFICNGKVIQGEHIMQFSCPSNVLGLPSIAFPTGKQSAALNAQTIPIQSLPIRCLPIGLQIIGPRLAEATLFRVLRSIKKTTRILA